MKLKHVFYTVLAGMIAFSCGKDADTAPDTPGGGDTPAPEVPAEPIAGCSLWMDFASGESDMIPDFSYAGYAWGERPLPDVDYRVFDILDFGARPDDGVSDREAFEAAVKAAEDYGRGAVIYVPEGVYELHDSAAPNSPIIIDGDNIVLRGAGRDKSVLSMSAPGSVQDASLWNTPEMLSFRFVRSRSDQQLKIADITGEAKSGSHDVEVSSPSGIAAGQRVLVKLAGDRRIQSVAAEVAPHDVDPEFSDLLSAGVQVAEYHTVKRISGNKVTLYEPLGHDIDPEGGWTLHAVLDRSGCGVEDICFRGAFRDKFSHHKDAVHDSGWRMLTFMRQAHGWIRRCSFVDVSEALSVMICANITVDDCIIDGNAGHSAIRSQASTNVLISNVEDRAGQYHSIGVSKTASHTVLLRCGIGDSTGFESHCSQPRNTLLDGCRGGWNPDHAGGDAALGPNHLKGLVVWNYTQTAGTAGEFPLWRRNNRFVMPVIAGFVGTATFNASETSALESMGTYVEPQSLYEAQLKLRTGK